MRTLLVVPLVLAGCSGMTEPPDASVDSGTPDSGMTADAGSQDAGVEDAGIEDAGAPDAGIEDAGIPDAGPLRQLVLTGGGSTIRVFAFQDGGLRLLGQHSAGSGGSFLAPDLERGRLYAVNEGSDEIAAFAFNARDAGLTLLNRVSSGGSGPAHVSVDRTGRFVFAANYGGGSVSVIPVTDAGLAPATQTLTMLGQAHQIFSDANNRFVYAPCKAADFIAQYAFDGGVLVPLSPPVLDTAESAGPRHLALHPTLPRAYLINELDDTVQPLTTDAQGRLTSLQKLSSLPSSFNGFNTGAEVAVHPNGKFVFASNRGHDSIARFSVDAVSGQLTLLGHTQSGGDTPRHFSIDATGTWLLVGNQSSGTLALFELDEVTGALTSRGVVGTTSNVGFAGFVTAP
ncbi:MAG: lactonase family protein [Archangium sp.]